MNGEGIKDPTADKAVANVMRKRKTSGLLFPKAGAKKKRRIRHPPSILQEKDGRCFLCMLLDNNNIYWPDLERHHVFGGSNRTASEAEGLTVYLCPRHHRTGPAGVHNSRKTDLIVKGYAEAAWEQNHTPEEFREKFGRNYL